jgi:hypothetical protein
MTDVPKKYTYKQWQAEVGSTMIVAPPKTLFHANDKYIAYLEQRVEELTVTGCVECGGIILADTEDFGPLCYEHYEEGEQKIRDLEFEVSQLRIRVKNMRKENGMEE